MEIELTSFFPYNHYRYGEAYFGSHKGMRYRLARDPLEMIVFKKKDELGPATLMATVWPEPYAYGKADKELMTSEHFDESPEGLEKAVAWINEQYLSRIDEWNKFLNN